MDKYQTIRKLFNGQIGLSDTVKCSDTYFQLMKQSDELERKFVKQLENNPELIELFDNVYEAQSKEYAESVFCHYAEGFRIGLMLGIEAAKSF